MLVEEECDDIDVDGLTGQNEERSGVPLGPDDCGPHQRRSVVLWTASAAWCSASLAATRASHGRRRGPRLPGTCLPQVRLG